MCAASLLTQLVFDAEMASNPIFSDSFLGIRAM